jgi:two-component system, LytTR family, response regulator
MDLTEKKIPGLWLINSHGAIRIDHDDILYCHCNNGVIKIAYSSGRILKVNASMKKLGSKLCKNKFYRCHRNYIINLAKANRKYSPDNDTIRLTRRHIIPVSRRKKVEMMEMLKHIPLAADISA